MIVFTPFVSTIHISGAFCEKGLYLSNIVLFAIWITRSEGRIGIDASDNIRRENGISVSCIKHYLIRPVCTLNFVNIVYIRFNIQLLNG